MFLSPKGHVSDRINPAPTATASNPIHFRELCFQPAIDNRPLLTLCRHRSPRIHSTETSQHPAAPQSMQPLDQAPGPSAATNNRLIIFALWLLLYASFTLFTPPLLDDADSVHSEV